MIRIKKGFDIPVKGQPVQEISPGAPVRSVALVADDYVGLRPAMEVREGDRVRLGQTLLTDKAHPEIRFTAPGAGTVRSVSRGAKRKLLSVEIDLDGDEQEPFPASDLASLSADQVRDQLLRSGLWTALRTRPFNRVPDPQTSPRSIFVTAMDSNPLAADPTVAIAEQAEDFVAGLHVLTRLTQGAIHVCHAAGTTVPGDGVPGVALTAFAGPHPAGLPGTHIHFLDPVHAHRMVWFIGYQDVMAFGVLLRTGQIRTERVIALAGPGVTQPASGPHPSRRVPGRRGQGQSGAGRAAGGIRFPAGRPSGLGSGELSGPVPQSDQCSAGRARARVVWLAAARLQQVLHHAHLCDGLAGWSGEGGLEHGHARRPPGHGADRSLREGHAAGPPAHAAACVR